MYCCHCEERLPETANFCLHCGRATTTEDSPHPVEVEKPAAASPTRAVATFPITVLRPQEHLVVVKIESALPQAAKTPAIRPSKTPKAPSEKRIRQLLADIYRARDQGYSFEAIKLCSKALHLVTDNSEVYFALGTVLEACHRFEEALVAYAQAIHIGTMPTSEFNVTAQALERTGRIFYEQQRYTQALQAINQSLQQDPRRGSLLWLKYDVLRRLNRFSEASSALNDYMFSPWRHS